MAQGDILLNDDNTIALDGAGNVRLLDADSDCPDCCDGDCTESESSCSNCDDTTPLQYEVTFSNTSLCTDCFLDQTPNSWTKIEYINAFVLNTVHTLDQTGGLCIWEKEYTVPNSLEASFYQSDSNCDEPASSSFEYDIRIRLQRNASDWELHVWARSAGNVGILFYDTQDADADGSDELCATVPDFTSDLVTCGANNEDPDNLRVWATGGTASVVCI